jgi:hypothetical protein
MDGDQTEFSCFATWIEQLYITLPTLVITVDDDLLRCAARLQALLSPLASESPPLSASDQTLSSALMDELRSTAACDAGNRLHIVEAVLNPVLVLADLHISAATSGVPVTIDTHRCGYVYVYCSTLDRPFSGALKHALPVQVAPCAFAGGSAQRAVPH